MNQTPYIAVIDPAFQTPELECLNQIALWSALPVNYHLPKLLGMHTLKRLSSPPAGIIVLGSKSSVHDQEPWQVEMNEWLLPMMHQGIPTLGLCYGHQLICHLFGAKVGFVNPEKEKLRGLREVELKPNRLWSDAKRGKLVVTHCEQVEECPEGFEVVGTSKEVAIDAVSHKTLPIWGFQPHPEASPYLISDHVFTQPELAFGHSLLQAFLDSVAESVR